MIAYISKYFGGPYGAGQSAIDVLEGLLHNQYDVAVTSYYKKFSNININSYKSNLKWYRVPNNRKIISLLPTKLTYPFYCYRQRFLRKAKIAIINSLGSHGIFNKVKNELKGKKVIIVRESPMHYQVPYQKLRLEWAIHALEQYDQYIFVSKNCQSSWSRLNALGRKKCYYVPNTCQESIANQLLNCKRSFIRKQLNFPDNKFIGVSVASIQYRKGQDLILKNIKKLLKINPNLLIYFVGPINGDWGNLLCQKIYKQKLDKYIKFLGTQTNAMKFIYAADFLLLTSRAEAMPRSILEGMALKTPIIATDVDGIPELIQDERSGFLFSPNTRNGLENAFLRFSQSQPKIDKIADNAHQMYWSKFSKEQQIRNFKNVIQEVLQDN